MRGLDIIVAVIYGDVYISDFEPNKENSFCPKTEWTSLQGDGAGLLSFKIRGDRSKIKNICKPYEEERGQN